MSKNIPCLTKPYPKFEYYTKPYAHQQEDFQLSGEREYWALFNEMGTGKSKPILDTAVDMFLKERIRGILIVSDKGCYLSWPMDQIPVHVSPNVPINMAVYSSHMCKAEASRVAEVCRAEQHGVLHILVVNVESLAFDSGCDVAATFLRNCPSMMVVDESTSIKNPKAKRTKNAILLGKLARVRRIATGTPVTQSPLDLFSQCEFLKPGLLGFSSFVAFKNYYAVTRRVIMGRMQYEEIVGYRNLEHLTESLRRFSSRRLKKDCLDLPEKLYQQVYVEQTPEQKAAYHAIKNEALLMLNQGTVVAVTNALTALTKLHQINSGHVSDENGVPHRIPTNRVSVLLELLEKYDGKVVIWGHYREDIRMIGEALRERFGHSSYVLYYGETEQADRASNLNSFQLNPECKYFVGTPAAGGKGLNQLTVASLCIYFSCHYNLERRLQSEDRLHRIGQKNNVTYIDLICPKTVDRAVLDALLAKKDLAHEVLDKVKMLFAD